LKQALEETYWQALWSNQRPPPCATLKVGGALLGAHTCAEILRVRADFMDPGQFAAPLSFE